MEAASLLLLDVVDDRGAAESVSKQHTCIALRTLLAARSLNGGSFDNNRVED